MRKTKKRLNVRKQKKNIIFCSWSEFKKRVASHLNEVEFDRWCYRGQQDEKAPLRTTFHRMAEKYGCPGCTADHLCGMTFTHYFDEIISQAHQCVSSVLDRQIEITNETQLISFLALLQHHGFPTPLLDWTQSPYIAAYFAFRDLNLATTKNKHVAVYALDTNMLNSVWPNMCITDIKTDNVKYIKIVKPVAYANPRVIPQQSVCSLTNIDKLDLWIWKNTPKDEQSCLVKIMLDVSEKPIIMRELNLMGINSMTMFPTLDGVCKFLKETLCPPKEKCNKTSRISSN